MASRKKPSLPVAEAAAPDSESLEYTTEVKPMSTDTLSSAPVPDRETQIREAAYAAHERRGGQGGDPAQDWLDAEAEWERQQKSSTKPIGSHGQVDDEARATLKAAHSTSHACGLLC